VIDQTRNMWCGEEGGSYICGEGLQALLIAGIDTDSFGFQFAERSDYRKGARSPFNPESLLGRVRAQHAVQIAALEKYLQAVNKESHDAQLR
jgi:hypothetical protein